MLLLSTDDEILSMYLDIYLIVYQGHEAGNI